MSLTYNRADVIAFGEDEYFEFLYRQCLLHPLWWYYRFILKGDALVWFRDFAYGVMAMTICRFSFFDIAISHKPHGWNDAENESTSNRYRRSISRLHRHFLFSPVLDERGNWWGKHDFQARRNNILALAMQKTSHWFQSEYEEWLLSWLMRRWCK